MTHIVTVCHYCKHVANDGNGYWHLVKCPVRLELVSKGREDAVLIDDRD